MKRHRPRLARSLVVAAAMLLASCQSDTGAAATRVFGHRGEQLILSPSATAHPRVTRSEAERTFDHPLEEPSVAKSHVVYEGIATLHSRGISDEIVTYSDRESEKATVSVASLEGRTVWIRVSEAGIGPHSCPARPVTPAPRVRPGPGTFAFAVMVDATTGDEADWSETLTSRICP